MEYSSSFTSGADLDRVVRFGKPGQILLEHCRNFLENVFSVNGDKIIKIISSVLSNYAIPVFLILQ